MNLDQSISLSPEVLSQEVAGETVLLDLASEIYFGLDEVGTRVWQLIRDNSELRPIYDTLLSEYDVSETELMNDLDALLTGAVEKGLIHMGDSA